LDGVTCATGKTWHRLLPPSLQLQIFPRSTNPLTIAIAQTLLPVPMRKSNAKAIRRQMTKGPSKILEIVALFGILCPAHGQVSQPVTQTATKSSCVNIVALSGAKVNCAHLTDEQQKAIADIPAILKMALEDQNYFKEIRDKLDDLFKAEHRPHISVSKLSLWDLKLKSTITDFKVGDPLAVNIAFKNTGSEQAVNFVPRYHIVFGSDITKIHADSPDKGIQASPVDGGGQEFVITPVSLSDPYSRPNAFLDPATVSSWDGSQPIILFGRFHYEDSKGVAYCDPFMFQYIAPNNWGRLSTTQYGFREKELCPP
jgi:hypothetical protein